MTGINRIEVVTVIEGIIIMLFGAGISDDNHNDIL